MQICFVFYPTKETWDPRFYKSNKSQAPYCVPLSAVLLWALHINIHPSPYPNSTPVFYASELLSVPEHVLFNFFTPAPLCLEFYLAIVFVHFGSCLFFKLVFYEIFPSCLLWQDNKPFLCSTYIYVSIFAKHYPDKNYLFTHDRELQEWGGGSMWYSHLLPGTEFGVKKGTKCLPVLLKWTDWHKHEEKGNQTLWLDSLKFVQCSGSEWTTFLTGKKYTLYIINIHSIIQYIWFR